MSNIQTRSQAISAHYGLGFSQLGQITGLRSAKELNICSDLANEGKDQAQSIVRAKTWLGVSQSEQSTGQKSANQGRLVFTNQNKV